MTYLADPGDPEAIDRLADTLGALVSGVAAGLVGDAVIVTGRADPAVETVADATGAALVPFRGGNPFSAGAAVARRPWVLCLEAGDVPAEGWIRTLDRFIGTTRPETGLGRLRRPGGFRLRAAGRIDLLLGARAARAGDVVRRDLLRAGPVFAPRLAVRPLTARLDRA